MTKEMGNAAPGLAGGITKSKDAAPAKVTIPQGAVHSSEIEYAMGNLSLNKVYDWTPEDHKVSEIMQNYFANFVKTGNPNGPGLPEWKPTGKGENAQYMHLDVKTRLETEKHRGRYLLMDSFLTKE